MYLIWYLIMVFIAIKSDLVNEKQHLFWFALNGSAGHTAVRRGGDELPSVSLLLEQSVMC